MRSTENVASDPLSVERAYQVMATDSIQVTLRFMPAINLGKLDRVLTNQRLFRWMYWQRHDE